MALETHRESSFIPRQAQHPRCPSAAAGTAHHSAQGTRASAGGRGGWLPSYLADDPLSFAGPAYSLFSFPSVLQGYLASRGQPTPLPLDHTLTPEPLQLPPRARPPLASQDDSHSPVSLPSPSALRPPLPKPQLFSFPLAPQSPDLALFPRALITICVCWFTCLWSVPPAPNVSSSGAGAALLTEQRAPGPGLPGTLRPTEGTRPVRGGRRGCAVPAVSTPLRPGSSTYLAESVLGHLVEDVQQGGVSALTVAHEEGDHGFAVRPPELHGPLQLRAERRQASESPGPHSTTPLSRRVTPIFRALAQTPSGPSSWSLTTGRTSLGALTAHQIAASFLSQM